MDTHINRITPPPALSKEVITYLWRVPAASN